jgi:hypothetical protein
MGTMGQERHLSKEVEVWGFGNGAIGTSIVLMINTVDGITDAYLRESCELPRFNPTHVMRRARRVYQHDLVRSRAIGNE